MACTVFSDIVSESNFEIAFKNTQRGQGKYKGRAIEFYRNKDFKLNELRHEVLTGNYLPSPYIHFTVTEPKERVIFAPQYRDKIVQHAINNIVSLAFQNRYIFDSYACIVGKGNQRAVLQLQQHLTKAHTSFGENAYLVKIDITKFFYSIDREILKSILRTRLRCVRTVELLSLIINHSPDTQGLPLGNLTSQLLANVYLDVLDQYCKRALKCEFYLRYADDIFIVTRNKQAAQYLLRHLAEYIRERLNLKIHPTKSTISPIRLGTVALGYRVHYNKILLLSKTKVKIKRILNKITTGPPSSLLELMKLEERINAYFNFINIANSFGFIQSLLEHYPFLYRNLKGVIKIRTDYLQLHNTA